MNLIITDNPNLHDKSNEDSILLYQVFDWRIHIKKIDIDIDDEIDNIEIEDEFELRKRFKKGVYRKKIELNSIITAIITPSNYKLIYDLLYIRDTYKKKVNFYTWDGWLKNKKIKINEGLIKKLFNEYIQRGYLTKIMYSDLEYFNLQRIEQFIILSIVNLGSKFIKTNKNGFINIDLFGKDELNVNKLMIKILLKNNSVFKTVDKLIYNSRKNDISDPFIDNLQFLNENKNYLKKYYNEINNNIIDEYIDDTNYLSSNPINIFSISYLLKSILPLTDILKTIRFLEKNDILKSDNKYGILSLHDYKDFDFSQYKEYIDPKKWLFLYKSKGYMFNELFPKIKITKLSYKCPLCGSSEFRLTPKHFYCSDINCKLYVNRLINPGGISKQVTELEFIRLINHGSTIIKNKIGGYNRFLLYKSNNVCKIISQIEKKIEDTF